MASAYVIGSGPNGLTAAIVLARSGVATTVIEAQPTVGGGTRSAALTLPGFIHDICSAVHPMAVVSPVFASFPLAEHGLDWIFSPSPLAHPMSDGSAVMLETSVEQTAAHLGKDGPMYRRLLEPLVKRQQDLFPELLGPLHVPSHPFLFARFGCLASWPATWAAKLFFRTPQARALLAGLAAHSIRPLEDIASGAIGWVLAVAGHAAGWPIPRGGSQNIADALASYFRSLGGRIVVNQTVDSLQELREADIVLCDVTPRQLLHLAGDRLPTAYRRKLEAYRYGPGVFKLDWALKAPIPWRAAECTRSATVHIGGTLENIAASEKLACGKSNGSTIGHIDRPPFVLLAQPSLFDSTRAPAGLHTAWAYCHVPNGSSVDMTAAIESQIERFAPGFRDIILARHSMTPAYMEQHNANLIGGDISGGSNDFKQLLFRPTESLYRTPVKGLYLCSSSTPPGAGVHGMCGYHAARTALKDAGLSEREETPWSK